MPDDKQRETVSLLTNVPRCANDGDTLWVLSADLQERVSVEEVMDVAMLRAGAICHLQDILMACR